MKCLEDSCPEFLGWHNLKPRYCKLGGVSFTENFNCLIDSELQRQEKEIIYLKSLREKIIEENAKECF